MVISDTVVRCYRSPEPTVRRHILREFFVSAQGRLFAGISAAVSTPKSVLITTDSFSRVNSFRAFRDLFARGSVSESHRVR